MDINHKALNLLLNKGEIGLSSNFVEHLDQNIKTTCSLLKIERTDIKKLIPLLNYDLTSSESTQWQFITLCFHILLTSDENSEIISVSYLSDVKTAFQFIVSLGILPNLIPGVGLDINVRFKNADVFPMEEIGVKDKYYRLCTITKMLLKCLTVDSLRNFILENHFNDLLATLLQLTAAPVKKPDKSNLELSEQFYFEVMSEGKNFQTDLHNLIIKTHQPLVFRELMFINGIKNSPIWLKNCVFKILSGRVQAKNGVESVIRALFDSQSNDTGQNWKHWEILTKLLMTKPNYANEKEYYENICGQLLKLLGKKSFEGKRIAKFETAVVLCTRYLFELNENLCFENFLKPLSAILEKYTEVSKVEVRNAAITEEIEQIIYVIHSIYIDYKTNDRIIPLNYLTPIFSVLFNLFCCCFTTNKNKLIDELGEIIVKYIENCDDKNNLYEYFLFDKKLKDILHLKNGYNFEIKDEIYLSKSTKINSRSDCCVYLLEKTQNKVFITTFFTYLLSSFINVFQNGGLCQNFDKISIDLTEKKLIIYQLLLKLLENKLILSNLKNNPNEILIFSENFLKIITQKNTHKSTDFDSEEFQTLFIIIMIINTILKNCDNKNLIEEFHILSKILKRISLETTNNEIKLLISEINLQNGGISNRKDPSEYEKAIEEICSPLIPEQAHGLATIVKLIEKKDLETCSKKQYVLNIFQQNLKSDESFIYLRAIAGLAILAESFPNIILETLTDEYAFPKGATEKDNEVRMKLGEVLVRTTRSLGESVLKYKGLLLNTFLTVSRDLDPLIRASSLSNLGEVCQVLGFRLGTIVTEILNCVHDSISYEVVEVRRAAVSVIRQLFIGLGQETLSVLKEDILPIYRTLKTTYKEDPDDVTRLQAQLALEELNEIMKKLLAPEIRHGKNR